ncbi:MAG: type II toxin-antitoxin system MqsA family antitoxin [Ruminococcus sp.]|jgi:YgiT-type zinc finger domain-containing protein|nr:type II toxin-antitoxin system MqsA family antitoxin [Ruminococcus sp.]
MTCFICKGNMTNSTTTYMEDLGNCIVIIKNVPCNKCTQCGEISYSGSTVKKIEAIINQLKNSLTEVAIVNYSAA